MKYTHPNQDHVYYVSTHMYGGRVQEYSNGTIPGKKLELNEDQFESFLNMLERNGWNESAYR